jgi:arsenate reductase
MTTPTAARRHGHPAWYAPEGAFVPGPDLFAALADPLRLTVARVLDAASVPLCVAEIVDITRRPQYAVSRALRRLHRTGLLTESREGKLVYYSCADDRRGEDAEETAIASVRRVVRAGREVDPEWPILRDRIRWRLEIRQGERCVVTYPAGRTDRRTAAVATERGTGAPAAHPGSDRAIAPASVLFVCVHNSARSQMAEEYLRRAGGERFHVESAGLEPGQLNPRVVAVLREDGIDITGKETRDVHDVYLAGTEFDYVITVCSREAEERCPVFPGPAVRLNWPFADPSAFRGTEEEILEQTRQVRDEIKRQVDEFVTVYDLRHPQ